MIGDEERLRLRQGTCLILWQVLTRTLRDKTVAKEVDQGQFEIILRVDEAERRALNSLAGAIQRAVPEVMSNDLQQLVAEEKRRIVSRP